MKIKVCGMRDAQNIVEVDKSGVDLMGFIFYDKSRRFAGDREPVPTKLVRRVGVFVNEDPRRIMEVADRWNLNTIQLHGDESPEDCNFLIRNQMEVIKSFSVGNDFDFSVMEAYIDDVDYFLFDTKGPKYGGNGIPFNWQILEGYDYDVPFWLSGGITPEMINAINRLRFPGLFGVDVNSGFEIEPGLKNIEKLKQFVDELQDR